MRRSTILVLTIALTFPVACGPEGGAPDASPPSAADTVMNAVDASLWTEDGLDVQLRMAWLRARIPSELGFSPGTTPWRPLAGETTAVGLSETGRNLTPGEHLLALSHALGFDGDLGRELWEQTIRVHDSGAGSAVGVILRWGFLDDSVVGHDLRVQMQERDGEWYVLSVEERFHCARGVADGGLCL